MRKILTLTMSGLVTVLPLALTIYVIWWLVNTVEGWLRRALIALQIVSPEHYWPGLGLITGFFLLLAVGSLVNAYIGKYCFAIGTTFWTVSRSSRRSTADFATWSVCCPPAAARNANCSASCWRVSPTCMPIGFVTREDVPTALEVHGGHDWVTVYFPMSYAFGGYTLYLPRDHIQPLDISVEDAMRLAITAGLTAGSRSKPS